MYGRKGENDMGIEEQVKELQNQVTNLTNLVNGYIKNQEKAKMYQNADIQGCRNTETGQERKIEQNTADIDFIAMETGVEL